jgi:hypothetical protein
MIKSRVILDKDGLFSFTEECYQLLTASRSEEDALKQISYLSIEKFGDYFSPDMLTEPDQISLNFIELLDQIIFELNENNSYLINVKSYIIDDLYNRVKIYLEVFQGIDIYKRSLAGRLICNDDAIIICQYRLSEFIPELMTEFYEQPHLQQSILRALISFDVENLQSFYYQVLQGAFCIEMKCIAAAGIFNSGQGFSNDEMLSSESSAVKNLVKYGKMFSVEELESNDLPYDVHALHFLLLLVELNLDRPLDLEAVKWIFKSSEVIWNDEIYRSHYFHIYQSLSHIIPRIDRSILSQHLKNEDNLISFLRLIDSFPTTYFNRISAQLDMLGDKFFHTSRDLYSDQIANTEIVESNIIHFLFE